MKHGKLRANKMDKLKSSKGGNSKENNRTERKKESGLKIQEVRTATCLGKTYKLWYCKKGTNRPRGKRE